MDRQQRLHAAVEMNRSRRRLLVLAWHNVEESWCFPSAPGTAQRGFVRQVRFLKRVANVVPLESALDCLASGNALPERPVSMTFDDGYRDNLTTAAPLLRSLGLPATFFLVPGLLSGSIVPWWEVLAWALVRSPKRFLTWEEKRFPLTTRHSRRAASKTISERMKRRDRTSRDEAVEQLVAQLEPQGSPGQLFLDWTGARRLQEYGFRIGSHSSYHAILSEESREDQFRDLSDSRRTLEAELGTPIDLVAYPNGTRRDFDATTIDAARQAGYRAALTTVRGWNGPSTSPYEIRRYVIRPELGLKAFLRLMMPVGRA